MCLCMCIGGVGGVEFLSRCGLLGSVFTSQQGASNEYYSQYTFSWKKKINHMFWLKKVPYLDRAMCI